MIPDLLLRFREKPVGGIADIKKTFLQIEIAPEDQDFLCFLWWDRREEPRKLEIYRHKRVVFGVNCSPFLLAAVIEYHLRRFCTQELSKKILRSLYVDNVVSSHEDVAAYEEFKRSSVAVLADAKFYLRLWESNMDVMGETVSTKVLGHRWDRKRDVLFCDVNVQVNLETVTKRSMLSVLAQIFDVLGVLAPATIVPKILLQECWELNLKVEVATILRIVESKRKISSRIRGRE